jgi:hypothetical protein
MLVVLPFQDWLSINGKYRRENILEELKQLLTLKVADRTLDGCKEYTVSLMLDNEEISSVTIDTYL